MFYGLSSDEGAAVRRIEQKLDAIMAHLGIADPTWPGLSRNVRRLADLGMTIDAIKLHREETGKGLAEGKAAIEEYLDRD